MVIVAREDRGRPWLFFHRKDASSGYIMLSDITNKIVIGVQ